MNTTPDKSIVRPPVVVIMGHIDHGKSTLLDHIRKSNITSREAGGITQHIGAYEVLHTTKNGDAGKITFLDTPGHEAFKSVRAKGASVADVSILIVSAEDGVKPQTKEAIEVAIASGAPYVVAINKIDSPKADINMTKQSLAEEGVFVEGYGGTIPVVEISAKNGTGVDELLDMLLLVIELEELKGDPSKPAEGVVVEAHTDTKKGISATLVIKDGTMKKGQFVATTTALSPVRLIENCHGDQCDEATFSAPVTIIGWNEMPHTGDEFHIFDTKKEAEQYVKEASLIQESSTDEIVRGELEDDCVHIPLIIKADAQGTIDAIEYELRKIETTRVCFKIIERGTGSITEANARVASSTPGAIIIGFGVIVDKQARAVLDRDEVDTELKTADVIYDIIDWLKEIVEKRTPKKMVDEVKGAAKILKIFNKVKHNHVIGGRVQEGVLRLGGTVQIIRRDTQIGDGKIKELQQQRAKTEMVADGEFGAMVDSSIELAEGDVIQATERVER